VKCLILNNAIITHLNVGANLIKAVILINIK
jgi:hypothetical protein